jgi:signal transduction histidine kinase
MKRSLKIVSQKQHMVRVESAKIKNGLASANAFSEQGIAHIEKKQPISNTTNELVLTISHYLNSPLTVLLGKVELLSHINENGGGSKEDIKKFVEACKREIFRIDSIIKAFQDICQVRHKIYPPGVKMLDVEKEIRNRVKETNFLR